MINKKEKENLSLEKRFIEIEKHFKVLLLARIVNLCLFFVLLVGIIVLVVNPQLILSNPVSFVSGVNSYDEKGVIGVVGNNIFVSCSGEFNCVIQKISV